MPNNDSPNVSAGAQAEHDASLDALIESTLAPDPVGGLPGDGDADGAEELEGEPQEEEAPPLGDEEELVEAPAEDQPEAPSETDRLQARVALKRDGWSEGDIDALPQESWIQRGLARAEAQAKNDEVYAERDRLRSLNGEPTSDSNSGQPGASDPQGASDPAMAGAVDLTELAGPVAEHIAEMSDPEEVAQALASFVGQAVTQATQEQRREAELEGRAREIASGRYEGDLAQVKQLAASLAQQGLHADKSGAEKFDALVDSALAALGAPAVETQNNSTSTAPPKRAARAPMGGRKAGPKPRTREQVLDARLSRILSGERDQSKLNAIR